MSNTYDYAVLRVVPRVERGEFVNVGVILSCAARRYLQAAIEVDKKRLQALAPGLDLATVCDGLQAIRRVCEGGPDAGPLGRLSVRERFHWLVAPRSSVIQTSPVHTGRCDDLDATLQRLMQRMVRVPDGEG